jgi:hypothetical protein
LVLSRIEQVGQKKRKRAGGDGEEALAAGGSGSGPGLAVRQAAEVNGYVGGLSRADAGGGIVGDSEFAKRGSTHRKSPLEVDPLGMARRIIALADVVAMVVDAARHGHAMVVKERAAPAEVAAVDGGGNGVDGSGSATSEGGAAKISHVSTISGSAPSVAGAATPTTQQKGEVLLTSTHTTTLTPITTAAASSLSPSTISSGETASSLTDALEEAVGALVVQPFAALFLDRFVWYDPDPAKDGSSNAQKKRKGSGSATSSETGSRGGAAGEGDGASEPEGGAGTGGSAESNTSVEEKYQCLLGDLQFDTCEFGLEDVRTLCSIACHQTRLTVWPCTPSIHRQ